MHAISFNMKTMIILIVFFFSSLVHAGTVNVQLSLDLNKVQALASQAVLDFYNRESGGKNLVVAEQLTNFEVFSIRMETIVSPTKTTYEAKSFSMSVNPNVVRDPVGSGVGDICSIGFVKLGNNWTLESADCSERD